MPVSSIQTGVSISGNQITGTLKYLDGSDPISGYWGAGNFMVLHFSNIDPKATSVKVGMDPSEGSGLVELLGDPDMNGVFKVTDKDTQVFKVVTSNGTNKPDLVQTFDLSGLTLEDS